MVQITVLKMTLEKESPWYTPVFRGIGWDVQSVGRLHHLPPKFGHILVAVITFSPFLLCRYF